MLISTHCDYNSHNIALYCPCFSYSQPLSQFIYVRLEEHFSRSGSLQQVQAATDQARMKSPADLGIRVSDVM